jgi:hypothetical protein
MKSLIRTVVSPKMEYTIISSSTSKEEKSLLGPKVIVDCVFQEADVPNANGHMFPKDGLISAIKKARPIINDRRLLGELDHPENIEDVNRLSTVMLKNVALVISDLKMDGNHVVGRFETLDTPNGIILSSLLRDKVKIGVSIRALTEQDITYDSSHINKINQFDLVTYDAVHNPAYSDSFVSSIISQTVFPVGGITLNDNLTISKEELKDFLSEYTKLIVNKLRRG